MNHLRFLLVWFCSFFSAYLIVKSPQETETVKLALMFFSAIVLDDIRQNTEKKGES